jgi:phosphatidylserine/phosphatidylglycerophosphate/cardiolipin synthase-like enzyme
MCDIPLDLQREFEQRWAARIARSAPAAASQRHRPECRDQQPAAPAVVERPSSGGCPDLDSGTAPLMIVMEPASRFPKTASHVKVARINATE